MKIIQTWLLIGTIEFLLALGLVAIAPIFLNSNHPWLGFLIWLMVPTMLMGSLVYICWRWIDALQARKLVVDRFPQYAYLKSTDFLDFPSEQVFQKLDMLAALQDDPDLRQLNISPLELLRKGKKR